MHSFGKVRPQGLRRQFGNSKHGPLPQRSNHHRDVELCNLQHDVVIFCGVRPYSTQGSVLEPNAASLMLCLAIGGKVDNCDDVRFLPQADMTLTGEKCPLTTQSGHEAHSK